MSSLPSWASHASEAKIASWSIEVPYVLPRDDVEVLGLEQLAGVGVDRSRGPARTRCRSSPGRHRSHRPRRRPCRTAGRRCSRSPDRGRPCAGRRTARPRCRSPTTPMLLPARSSGVVMPASLNETWRVGERWKIWPMTTPSAPDSRGASMRGTQLMPNSAWPPATTVRGHDLDRAGQDRDVEALVGVVALGQRPRSSPRTGPAGTTAAAAGSGSVHRSGTGLGARAGSALGAVVAAPLGAVELPPPEHAAAAIVAAANSATRRRVRMGLLSHPDRTVESVLLLQWRSLAKVATADTRPSSVPVALRMRPRNRRTGARRRQTLSSALRAVVPGHDQPLGDDDDQVQADADGAGEDDGRPRALEVEERRVRRDVLPQAGARRREVLADDGADGRQGHRQPERREDVRQRVRGPAACGRPRTRARRTSASAPAPRRPPTVRPRTVLIMTGKKHSGRGDHRLGQLLVQPEPVVEQRGEGQDRDRARRDRERHQRVAGRPIARGDDAHDDARRWPR